MRFGALGSMRMGAPGAAAETLRSRISMLCCVAMQLMTAAMKKSTAAESVRGVVGWRK